MQQIVRFLLCLGSLLLILPSAVGETPAPKAIGKMVVYFTTENPDDLWLARTYQESAKSYISAFSNLILDENPEAFSTCGDQKCRIKSLKEQETDYLWSGVFDGHELDYKIVDVQSGATVASGELKFDPWNGHNLQLQVLTAIRPIVRTGGLIDLRGEKNKVIQRLEVTEKIQVYFDKSLMTNFGWLVALLGGISWAFVFLKLSQFVLGNFAGIHRINHSSLGLYLQSWLEVFLGKTLLVLVIFAIPMVATYFALVPKLFSAQFYFMIVSPLIAIGIFSVVYIIHSSFTKILDRVLLKKQKENPWQPKVQKYFRGYIKRLGVDLPEYLMEDIRFYVRDTDRIWTYGGYGLETRIVLPIWIAEPALGAIPTYKKIRDAEEKSPFQVDRVPTYELEARSLITSKAMRTTVKNRPSEDSYDDFEKDFRKKSAEFEIIDSKSAAPPFSSQAGVWGFVLPSKTKSSVPLISDDVQDLEVVEDLISEHHIHFAKPYYEEEFDDSDPNQKDFLFGLLLREIGFVHRREIILTTAHLFFVTVINKLPRYLLMPFNLFEEFYDRNYSRFPTFMADSYVALNHGGQHLIQYLYFLGTQKKSMMTSRAGRKNLTLRVNEILNWVASQETSARDLNRNRATLRNRFLWIAAYFQYGFKDAQTGRRVPWKRILAALALVGAVSIEGYAAMKFRPTYLERVTAMNSKVEDYELDQEDIKAGKPPRSKMKQDQVTAPTPATMEVVPPEAAAKIAKRAALGAPVKVEKAKPAEKSRAKATKTKSTPKKQNKKPAAKAKSKSAAPKKGKKK